MRKCRETAKLNGATLKSDSWHKDNPEKHRKRVAKWRGENQEASREISRQNQAARRSTPWGKINNRIRAIQNKGIAKSSERIGKYNAVIGHTWLELRKHIESQFDNEMNWDNWGTVWEIDHIKPVSLFKYESIEDPEFYECWRLENLRPLKKVENQKKGSSFKLVHHE